MNYQGRMYEQVATDETEQSMNSLESGTALSQALALVCPCYVYAKTIGYLHNKDSADTMTCCFWTGIECAGIVGSNLSASLVASQPLGSLLYIIIGLANCIPHCLFVLPLSLEMRARENNLSSAQCEIQSILETAFCPCCVLAAVEQWAQKNKGKVILKQKGCCICPPMKLTTLPTPMQMA
jgi:hypothetical protein